MSGDSDNGAAFGISAELGSLSLEVQGTDSEWVSEQFDDKLETLLDESEEMSKALRDGSRRIA